LETTFTECPHADCAPASSEKAEGKMPKVLAVVPVFNGRHFASEAIKSLLSQDYPNLRIVVIDDRSKADLGSLILKEFSKFPQITVIRNEENIGLAQTLNKALELITDEDFLFVLQQDCELLSNDYIMGAFQHFRYNNDVAMVSGENSLLGIKELSPMKKIFVHHLCEDAHDEGTVDVGFQLLKADLFRVEVLKKAGGFESSAKWKLASEDNIISYKIRSLGYRMIKDPSLEFAAYWDGQEKLWQNLRKEAVYGRGLGWALARRKSDLKVGESKQLRSKRLSRMIQLQYVLLTLLSVVLFLFDWSISLILLSSAALIQLGYLCHRARILSGTKERLLFIATGFLRAWVYIPNFCFGFLLGLTSNKRKK
jgi:glycosyltransferase involved in cell wall biosynthesis